ncbi:hypothetical protein J2T60_000155 [Natronospira proteinivora]|uniref:Uncharacterized protein n=1 Tax=Natronospira proteinivora TaxID=1807133 RepID=A0ABT1G5H5_9GAMM|nr:hypothetical protein [Natronospira proteinivora]MCP1726190.1 hypothetical protein [Natronospira proteinivora]
MRGRDNKAGGSKDTIPTLREVVRPGAAQQNPPNLDLFEDPPAGNGEENPDAPTENERLQAAFMEELDRRVENLVRSRVQRLADALAEDVMKTLKREIRNIAQEQKR